MPEDIPEDLELPPDPPPPPPPSLPPEPPKNPDFWLFVGITLGVFCALVFSLLQMDNVQINWQLSAILYALFTGGAVASFLVHAAPHRSKLVRFIGSFIMLALFGALGFWGDSLGIQKAARTARHYTLKPSFIHCKGSE